MIKVSILIVHYNTPGLLRQTLRAIRRAAPRCRYEILVVDNNPGCRVFDWLQTDFPEARVLISESNLGFGQGMNLAMREAKGELFFVFNPDTVLQPGTIEALVDYLQEHEEVGLVGPKLCHPDGGLQYSCYRFMTPKMILYRRLPGLGRLPAVKRALRRYLMVDWDHLQVRAVDYLLGAAVMARRSAVEAVGGFDPQFFVYFEDQDWCWRFWRAGWHVHYLPTVSLIHYHRRETATGSFVSQLFNPLTRVQMQSAWRYYRKWRGQNNPRLAIMKDEESLEAQS